MSNVACAQRLIGVFCIALSACAASIDKVCPAGPDNAIRARAVSILRDGLKDDEFWPSMHAAEGLTAAGFGGEVRQYLESQLINETDDRRLAGIARELVRAGDPSKIEILTALMRDEDPSSHVYAAESLFKIAEIGDQGAMIRAFHSTEPVALRLMAAAALARRGDSAALDAIRTAVDTGDIGATRVAAWLLGQVGAVDDLPLLRSRLDESDELTLAYIHHAMAALGDPAGLAELVRNLYSRNTAVRTQAAAVARAAGVQACCGRLIELLDDPANDTRYAAAHSLIVLAARQSASCSRVK